MSIISANASNEMSITSNYDYSNFKVIVDTIPESFDGYEAICPVINVNEKINIAEGSSDLNNCLYAVKKIDSRDDKTYLRDGQISHQYDVNFNKYDNISMAFVFVLRENGNISKFEIYTVTKQMSNKRFKVQYSDLKKVYEKNYKGETGIDDIETSNDEVQQSQKTVKTIENGRMVIYKKGRKYSTVGALME